MNPDKKRLFDNYDRIGSRHGGLLDGKAVFRGVDVNKDLAGKKTQTEVMLLGLTGRFPDERETKLFDALICMNVYPDPRIWTMRAGAYAAANRSPFSSAYSAALVSFNSRIYGTQPIVECGRFIIRSLEAMDRGVSLTEVLAGERIRDRYIPGFGRPVVPGPDERYAKSLSLLEECGFTPGPALTFIKKAAEFLQTEKGVWPNFAAALAPLMLDPPFSLTADQLYPVSQCIVHIPLMFAVQDVVENHGERSPFLPLKTEDVHYTGCGYRQLPKTECY